MHIHAIVTTLDRRTSVHRTKYCRSSHGNVQLVVDITLLKVALLSVQVKPRSPDCDLYDYY